MARVQTAFGRFEPTAFEHRVPTPTLFATPQDQRDQSREIIKDAQEALNTASEIFKEAQDALNTVHEELHNKQTAVAAAEAAVTDLQNTIQDNPLNVFWADRAVILGSIGPKDV